MLAIRAHRAGGVEVLQWDDVASPDCPADNILIRNEFVGVNYGDVIRRQRGWGHEGPFTPGFEGVGVIIQVGTNVDGFKVGDRVAYLMAYGAYAEIVSIPAKQVFLVPNDLAPETVAGSVCAGTTAIGLFNKAGLTDGNTAIVHGAAGGVGALLLQLCQESRIKAIACVSTEDKEAYVRSLGSSTVVRTDTEDFSLRALELTNGSGVDAIFDCVGQAVTAGNGASIRKQGRWLYYGSASGHGQFPGEVVLTRAVNISGFVIFNVLADFIAWNGVVAQLLEKLRHKSLMPQVETLPATAVRQVHERLENRKFIGKAVLDFRSVNPNGGDFK